MQKWRMPEAGGQEACAPWPLRAVAVPPVLSALAFLALPAFLARLVRFVNTPPHGSGHRTHQARSLRCFFENNPL